MPGIMGLPIILAQCDALISLVDEGYYDRAWCCVEVQLISTLQRSYGWHLWYEQTIGGNGVDGKTQENITQQQYIIRPGPRDFACSMALKTLSFKSDRPKILFLERQTNLFR